MELFFEFGDLIRTNNNDKVDWQYLCLATEELLLAPDWYDKGGLKNRSRILRLLKGIENTFSSMLEQEQQKVL